MLVALDNRIGGFMIVEVLRLLKENKVKLPFGLYITNSVQEEVGLRGAQMIVDTIRPNVAIVTDVCHDTGTPMIDKIKQGDTKCGDGPVLTYALPVQNNLLDLIINTAETNKIPFQKSVKLLEPPEQIPTHWLFYWWCYQPLISLSLRYICIQQLKLFIKMM